MTKRTENKKYRISYVKQRLKSRRFTRIFAIIAMSICLVAICCMKTVHVQKTVGEPPVIAIDVGHGGFDPGKVGLSGSLEKNINLAIGLKLRAYLESQGIEVVMTREEDVALGDTGEEKKKSADMRKRVELMNGSEACLAVSIHQNSFTSGNVRGAQVFYYGESQAGKGLAEQIQSSIKEVLKDENTRQAKSNSDYYVLRKTNCPIVIVECGFLSNAQEELLLLEEDYQEKIAQGIGLGICRCLDDHILLEQ